ncbi:alpha/beta fold hydrolase [Streptomyces clavifer]|uniref:alpha/beta fold hydrolase n=1 Tax=Streptomyces clavifer TaxID=68188 RepID=UPI0036907CEA
MSRGGARIGSHGGRCRTGPWHWPHAPDGPMSMPWESMSARSRPHPVWWWFPAPTSTLPPACRWSPRWPSYVVDVPGQPGLSAADRPGHHRSARYGQWLQEVLDEISPGPTVVVGHSLSGAIALACDVPRLTGRVLVSPAGLTRLKVTGRVLAATLPWLARPTEARSATLLRQMHGSGRYPSAEPVTWMTLLARSCRSGLAPAPLPEGTLARSRRVTNVVATGEHDVFLPPSRLAAPAFRHLGVAVTTVPGAGHLVVEEHPETIVTLVAALMSGNMADGLLRRPLTTTSRLG